jgi:hypothetical protein
VVRTVVVIQEVEVQVLREMSVVTGVVTTLFLTLTTETNLRNYPGQMEHSYQITELIVLTVIIPM